MKSKVTLKEKIGTQIIYAGLLVCYYWMWARRDWHTYYPTIQNTIFIFTILFFAMQASRIRKYSKEVRASETALNLWPFPGTSSAFGESKPNTSPYIFL